MKIGSGLKSIVAPLVRVGFIDSSDGIEMEKGRDIDGKGRDGGGKRWRRYEMEEGRDVEMQ